MINYEKMLSKTVCDLKPSGIRRFFDMLADNETFAMVALRNLLGADISQLAAASIRQEAVRRLNITSSGKPKVKASTQGGGTKVNPNRRPIVPGGIIDSNK